MKRHCLAVDLINDPALIAAYDAQHQQVWPAIIDSIRDSGIIAMEIYRTGNRLFMIIEANDSFSFEQKSIADASNQQVQDWEALMWNYQQALPTANPGEKWILMNKIFAFNA